MKSITQHLLVTVLLVSTVIPMAESACPPIYVFTGEAAGDNLGQSVASAGDVNNDGFADLIVGAPLNDATGEDAGRAYVFSGLNGDTLYVFNGAAEFDRFGFSVASAGDVNGDGFADLIVGAFTNDAGGLLAGRAYVFSGINGDTLYVFTGEAAGDKFGYSVASAGDVNNDGFDDLIVGSIFNDAGAFNAGRAYVFSGIDGDTLHVFTGEGASDQFGNSVASAGDVNGDGFYDLIVGALQNDAGGTAAGRAYVFSGFDGNMLHVFTGEAFNNQLGTSVASAGDVDSDGLDDLIIGAPFYDSKALGRAYVLSGKTNDTIHIFTGAVLVEHLGGSVATGGDINNDGFADLIIGSTRGETDGVVTGRVSVFSGTNGDTLMVFSGDGFDGFGTSVGSVGDVNGDGFVDLFVGAPFNDSSGVNAGRVFVYSGAPDRSCCIDLTGNIDGDMNDIVDISDLTVLIDNLFINFTPLACPAEGNIDGDPLNRVDITDLTLLIDHLFINFPPTAACQ